MAQKMLKATRVGSVMTFKEEKQRANETYRMIFDARGLTQQVGKICSSLGIDPETLHVKRLQTFETEFADADVAKLHHRHYQKRRQKNLLRIADSINSPPIDAEDLRRVQRQTKSIDVSTFKNDSPGNRYNRKGDMTEYQDARQNRILNNYSSMSLKKSGAMFDKRMEENYVRVSSIFEKRKKKEQIVLQNLKFTIQDKKHRAKEFSQKQKLVTEKVTKHNYMQERARYSSWRKDLEEVDARVRQRQQSLDRQDHEGSLSRSVHQQSRASLAGTLNGVKGSLNQDLDIDQQLREIDSKLELGVIRA